MKHLTAALAFCTLTLVLQTLGGCAQRSQPVAPDAADGPFERAVALAEAGEDDAALAALRAALEDDTNAVVQQALLEPAFQESGLRDTPEFREVIRDAAIRHRVSELTLVGDDEPGEWIEIEGRTVDSEGAPVPGARVYLYGTAEDGLYHPEIEEGDRMPRIFGYFITDADGRFSVRTVRPGPYPGTRDARHIHIDARTDSMRLAAPHYAVFDDDPLLFEPQNAEQRGEALRIAMTMRASEHGEAKGMLTLPLR